MKLMSFALCVLLAALSGPTQAQKVTDTVFVKDILRTFESGTLADREQMISRVVAAKVMVKSSDVARAVARELERINSVVRQRQEHLAAGVANPEAPDIGEYYGALMQACSQTTDPVVIDGLLGAIATGNMATDALARFGPIVLERVAVIASSDEDPLRVVSAEATLRKIMLTHALTADQRLRVVDVARSRMRGLQHPLVWRSVLRLAIVTEDPELRRRVAATAAGTELPAVTRSEDRTMIQDAAIGALAGRKTP